MSTPAHGASATLAIPPGQKLAIEAVSRKGAVTVKLKPARIDVLEGLNRTPRQRSRARIRSLRFALRKPHVLAFYRSECYALRKLLKAALPARLDTHRRHSKNDMPAWPASILSSRSATSPERQGKPGGRPPARISDCGS